MEKYDAGSNKEGVGTRQKQRTIAKQSETWIGSAQVDHNRLFAATMGEIAQASFGRDFLLSETQLKTPALSCCTRIHTTLKQNPRTSKVETSEFVLRFEEGAIQNAFQMQ